MNTKNTSVNYFHDEHFSKLPDLMSEECPDIYNNLTSTLGLDTLKLEVGIVALTYDSGIQLAVRSQWPQPLATSTNFSIMFN